MKQAALLLMAFAMLMKGQAVSRSVPIPRSDPEATLPAQKIGPNDLLSVSVEDCPELTHNFRVSADGTLALPLLKKKLSVAGKLPEEIETEISQALIDNQLLVRPVVSVSVAEYRSVPVSVMGCVKRPITFQAVGGVTLLDALAKAEGLSADAGPEILVSRADAQNGSPGLLRRIPVKGLIDNAEPALNIRLYGGEEIRVPAVGRVYVVGNVKKSGAFPILDGGNTTVLKAIALSEGLLPYTNKQAFIYRTEAGTSGRNEIPIELSRIMDRKAPDVRLQANDILYIPDSKGRRMTAQTLERLAGFGSATGSGLLIWR
jgi:polysaccharide export outer membrane protein